MGSVPNYFERIVGACAGLLERARVCTLVFLRVRLRVCVWLLKWQLELTHVPPQDGAFSTSASAHTRRRTRRQRRRAPDMKARCAPSRAEGFVASGGAAAFVGVPKAAASGGVGNGGEKTQQTRDLHEVVEEEEEEKEKSEERS